MREVSETIGTVKEVLGGSDMPYAGHSLVQRVNEWLLSLGMNEAGADVMDSFILLLLIVGVAFLLNWVCRRIILRTVSKLVQRTKATWDDIVFNDKVMTNFSRMVAPVLLYVA